MNLLKISDLVELKELQYKGSKFFVRPLKVKTLIDIQKAEMIPEEQGLVIFRECVCDETGKPLFTDDQINEIPPDDFQAISLMVTDALGLGEQKN